MNLDDKWQDFAKTVGDRAEIINPPECECGRPAGHAGPHVAGSYVWGEDVEPKKCSVCGK